jgi:hypothetical protein
LRVLVVDGQKCTGSPEGVLNGVATSAKQRRAGRNRQPPHGVGLGLPLSPVRPWRRIGASQSNPVDESASEMSGNDVKKGPLADAESRYRDLVLACDQAIVIAAASTVVFANDAAVGLLGATQAAQVVGRPVAEFFALPPVT